MPFLVDADYIRGRVLPTLIGPGARYAGVLDPQDIQDTVVQVAREVEQQLSTRFSVTEFRSWMGPGARPENVPAVPPSEGGPGAMAIEFIDPVPWPSQSPGPGYLTFLFPFRPLYEIVKGTLQLPGTATPGLQLQPDWFRVDAHKGEATFMPKYGSSAMVAAQLPFGLWQLVSQRLPDSLLWTFRAGLTESDWTRFPQINRLVGLRVACKLLPTISNKINPSGATSSSADGLSVTRKSGYVFADLEERLTKEADALLTVVLDAWDGTSSLSIF